MSRWDTTGSHVSCPQRYFMNHGLYDNIGSGLSRGWSYQHREKHDLYREIWNFCYSLKAFERKGCIDERGFYIRVYP